MNVCVYVYCYGKNYCHSYLNGKEYFIQDCCDRCQDYCNKGKRLGSTHCNKNKWEFIAREAGYGD